MNVEKTIEFILEQQAKNEVRHSKNEALRAEHKAEIKEIRRLLLRGAAMQVQDRKFLRSLAEEMRLLAEESRETKREVRDLTRALRGRNGASGNGGKRH
jgi:DNA-binding ferritin-like protein (Dps family)